MAESAASPPSYTFRASLFQSERAFKLASDGLIVGDRQLYYRDVDRVRLYQIRAQDGGMIGRCKVCAGDRVVLLQSAHIAAWGRVQDRSPQYEPFVQELLRRIAHAKPGVLVSAGTSRTTRAGWLLVLVLVAALALGGLAQVATGEWEGLWLVGTALTTGPLAVSMISKRPTRLVKIEDVTAADGFRGLFG